MEVKFVSTTGKDQVSKTVVEVKFEHSKIKSRCKRCGGSHICEHNKIRSCCFFCGRSQICECNKQRPSCKDFNSLRHLSGVVQGRVCIALKNDQEMSSTE